MSTGGGAVILVGGPGGSSEREIDPEVSDRGPTFILDCPQAARTWDRSLIEGDFEAVVAETGPEAQSSELGTLALLYNSLGRLYSGGDPARALTDLDRVAGDAAGTARCGERGPALLSEGTMFASAALGDFARAERQLAVVAELAPTAASGLAAQLEELQEVTESPAPSDGPASESPTPTESPTESPTPTP